MERKCLQVSNHTCSVRKDGDHLRGIFAKKPSAAILWSLAVIGVVAVTIAMQRHGTASAQSHVSLQASVKTAGAKRRASVLPAAPSNATKVLFLGYSETKHAQLRQRYKSPQPQAFGVLSSSRLKLLDRVMSEAIVGNRHLLPVVKEVIYGNATALASRLDTGLNPDSTVFVGYPYDSNISLLDIAIRAGQRNIVEMLLAHGASVNPPEAIVQNGMIY